MSSNSLFRTLTAVMLFIWLPIGAFAGNNTAIFPTSNPDLYQDKREKKQEREKESKKPEVKEVPQSRRQEKPGEVKSDKRERPQENKRRN
ncbi:hypothetical protein [Pedobacter nyackensis]|nr:hypothetical protein [Pedobacter nyackensis]